MTEIQIQYNDAIYDIENLTKSIESYIDKHSSILNYDQVVNLTSWASSMLLIYNFLQQKRDFHESEKETKASMKNLLDNGYTKEQLIKMIDSLQKNKGGLV